MRIKKVVILFFGDLNYDSRCSKFIDTLLKNNFEIDIINVSGINKNELNSFRQHPDFRNIKISLKYGRKTPFLKYYFKSFFKAIFKKADIYLSADLYSLPIAYICSFFHGGKLFYDSRELYSNIAALKNKRFKQKIWILIEKTIIKRCDKIFTVNNSLSDKLQNNYKIKKPIVIYNVPRLSTQKNPINLHQKLGIESDKKILLSQGGLQMGRGVLILLEIIPYLENCVCLFLGQGFLSTNIKHHTLFNKKIFLLENVKANELLSYTCGADIGICLIEDFGTSYYYSLPNKLFEYIHAGLPVLGSDFPEIERIIKGNKIGEISDPANKDEIIKKLRILLDNQEIYSYYKNNCKSVSEVFNWENQEDKLINAFK